MAGRLLAELGARVIRVESSEGDWIRRRGPLVDDRPGIERSLAHVLNNAGKQSVAADLSREETWEAVGRIAAKSDVLIAPIEPVSLCSSFIGEAHLRTIAPRLGVVDAVFRRGSSDGAVSDLAGTAAGGMLRLNGDPGDPPNHPAGQLAYKQTSLAAAWAAMSLVLQRSTGQPGGRITVSMQEAMMWTTIQTANENYWYWHQTRPNRTGIAGLGGRTIFKTRDGKWVSFYQHPPAWPAFVDWVTAELDESHLEGPDWSDGLYRFQNFAVVVEATAALCRSMDRDELVAEAQRRQILVVPVQDAGDIAQDAHLRSRDFFQQVSYPQLGRELEVMRSPFRSSEYEVVPAPAPPLGEHTVSVLEELGGYSRSEIEQLIGAGVVSAPALVNL
jgi:benzylsuccinate CoA-transferase BbsE subunit